jgi:N-acetylglutamate synthase-like GNAT family acetyltransferase
MSNLDEKFDINKKTTITYICFNPTKHNLEDIKVLIEHNTYSIHIYPNNEDTNNSYENIKNYISTKIINEIFCKGLSYGYIFDSFDNVDAVVIIGDSNDILPNGNIFGFALIKFNQKRNSIYIDVICSHYGIKGAGKKLIEEIENISKTLSMKKIYLNSVKKVISFYEKYGFIKDYEKSCKIDTCKKMIKYINGGKRKTQKKSRKINKTRKNRLSLRSKCKRSKTLIYNYI